MATYSGSTSTGQQEDAEGVFAKTFLVGKRQLLVYIDYADDGGDDDDDDIVALRQIVWLEPGGMLVITVRGVTHAVERLLAAYDQERAEAFFALPVVKSVTVGPFHG